MSEITKLQEAVVTLVAQRDNLLGIFSDFDDPCTTVDQARFIWNMVRNREEAVNEKLRRLQKVCAPIIKLHTEKGRCSRKDCDACDVLDALAKELAGNA